MLILIFVSQKLCYFVIQCIRIDLAKSVQIFKHPIKFGQALSTGTAMPLLMKQIGMY